MHILGAAGVPAGAVLDTQELHDEPSFDRRGIMQVMPHPVCGPFKMPTWPVRHNGETPTVRPAPQLGQHTEEVLNDWLGLKAEAIAALRADRVV